MDGNRNVGGSSIPRTGAWSAGNYSWNGGKSPSSFDSKLFGTGVAGDLANWYKSPLQTNPYSDFVDFNDTTKGLIGQGINNASSVFGNDKLKGMASGGMLGAGNPYLEQYLSDTRGDTLASIGAQMGSAGRFGGSPYVQTAADTISKNENAARMGQYNQDVSNMFTAQGALNDATATGLGYSSLYDQKAREQQQSKQKMWDLQNNAAPNRIGQAMGLLRGTDGQTNQPTSFWDILGTGANLLGSFLPFLL